jgi:hypothetical protein
VYKTQRLRQNLRSDNPDYVNEKNYKQSSRQPLGFIAGGAAFKGAKNIPTGNIYLN